MKNSPKILAILFCIALLLGVLYISSSKPPTVSVDGKLQIVASIYPVAFFAEQIAGDLANVATIVPAGVEPHEYEPTPADIAAMYSTDVVVVNGGMEPWAESVMANLPDGVAGVVAGGGTMLESGSADPHVWLDPVLAKRMVEPIATVLSSVYSEHAGEFQRRTAQLFERLDALDAQYRAGLANCAKKDIVVSHSAFGHLAARYGLRQIALTGISPEEEPTVKDLAEVAQFVRENGVEYIFFESLVSPELAETIAKEAGAKTLELNPIEGHPDGVAGRDNPRVVPTKSQDYFTVMAQNLINLKLALQCTP